MELNFYRGRVALHAILKGLGIGKGDEVATQAFTCIAVPEAIIAAGAKPVYVDIERLGVNMHAEDLLRKITEKTRAIVVQHTFGVPADILRIADIARQYNIPIIEDCCHTLQSKYNGKITGSFGVGSFYSYEWGKPAVAGIGGTAKINDDELKQKVLQDYSVKYKMPDTITDYKIKVQYLAFKILYRPVLYWPVRWLFHSLSSLGVAEGNYNPLDNNGTPSQDFSMKMSRHSYNTLCKKLKDTESQTEYSCIVAKEYINGIKSSAVSHLSYDPNSDIVFARYPLIAKSKQKLLEKARISNIELADWYNTPLHPLKNDEWHLVYYNAGTCPNAEEMSDKIISLPVHRMVSKGYIRRTIKFFNEVQI